MRKQGIDGTGMLNLYDRVTGIFNEIFDSRLLTAAIFALIGYCSLFTQRKFPMRWMIFVLFGMILLAFVLGFPANEIVLPILLMGYLQEGSLTACAGLGELQTVFTANGWTARTALGMVLLCLMHFPCGTTVLTIRRETGSLRWTAVGFLLPLGMGAVLCILANFLMGLTG